MIETESSEVYKKEILEQIEEYKKQNILTKREAGIVLWTKLDIFAQFHIMDLDDIAELSRIVEKEFGIDFDELWSIVY